MLRAVGPRARVFYRHLIRVEVVETEKENYLKNNVNKISTNCTCISLMKKKKKKNLVANKAKQREITRFRNGSTKWFRTEKPNDSLMKPRGRWPAREKLWRKFITFDRSNNGNYHRRINIINKRRRAATGAPQADRTCTNKGEGGGMGQNQWAKNKTCTEKGCPPPPASTFLPPPLVILIS